MGAYDTKSSKSPPGPGKSGRYSVNIDFEAGKDVFNEWFCEIRRYTLHYITLHYTFDQSVGYSHIIDYLGKQYAEFNEHKYA